MPEQIKLTPEEGRIVTPFFSWADGYRAGMEAALNAARQRMVSDMLAARIAPEAPKEEEVNGNPV